MNLHGLVCGSINAVNRNGQLTWLASQGYITDNTGLSVPNYAAPKTVWGQVQPLPTDRLSHMEQLNIQGVLRAVYLRGAVASAVRPDGTGGDLLQFPETPSGPQRTWLVVLVDEQWDCWCRVTVQLQNDMNISWTADSSVPADSTRPAG
jgi:hypothetical protein